MSDTNRVAVRIVEESTFGTTPATPAFEELRVTEANPSFQPNTVTSNEIRSDRQVTDLILVGAEAGGPLGLEVSHGALDTLIEGAMFSDWSNKAMRYNATSDSSITDVIASSDTFEVVSAGGTFVEGDLVYTTGFTNSGNNGLFRAESGTSATEVVVPSSPGLTNESAPPAGARIRKVGFQGATGDIEATTSGGNALISTSLGLNTLGLVAGEWLYVGGAAAGNKFGTAANTGWVRIAADGIAANRLDLDIVPSGWATDDGSTKAIQVFCGDLIRNGVAEHSYSIEREFSDHSPVTYEYLRGMEVGTLVLAAESESIMTANATFMGKDAVMQDSARFSGATTVAAPTGDVLNTSSNVGRIAEAGSVVSGPNYPQTVTINLENNLRRRTAIGTLGAVSMGAGEFSVTGSIGTYFGNKTLAQKVIDNTATSFDMVVGRADGVKPALVIDLPRMKYSAGSPQVPGKNQDVMVDLQFQAYRHPDLGYTLAIQRHHYLP
ncbi:MAG: phage tail tube protein [Alphaproteobacteria bacterium]